MRKFLLLLLIPVPALAGAPCGGFDKPAAEVAALVAEKPEGLERTFDKSLFKHISREKLAGVFAGLRRDHGAVTARVFVSSDTSCSAHYLLDTDRGWRLPVALTMNPATGKLSGIFFSPPYRRDLTLAKARAELAALPGRAGLLAIKLGEKPETVEALEPDAALAVGSAFKLYVLGAMLESRMPWDKVLRLKEEQRSLPGGKLAGWPDGAPLTAYSLAALMISESDNTATDALLYSLGRRRVEAALPALGHSAPDRLKPFLSTGEFFRLKADSEAALKYRALEGEDRYSFLDSLRAVPLSAGGLRPDPFGLDSVEWHASPADLCRAMGYFLRRDDKRALDILAINTGLKMPPGKYLYAGYKGGSEPGVLAMAWLLKDARSDWYCLAAAWNDEKEALDEAKFFAVMRGALEALASRGNGVRS